MKTLRPWLTSTKHGNGYEKNRQLWLIAVTALCYLYGNASFDAVLHSNAGTEKSDAVSHTVPHLSTETEKDNVVADGIELS